MYICDSIYVYRLILNYLTISLVFWNTLTLILVLISVDLTNNQYGQPEIHPQNTSWFYTKVNSEISTPKLVIAIISKLIISMLHVC